MAAARLQSIALNENRGVKIRSRLDDSSTIMEINTSNTYPSSIVDRWRDNEGFKKVFLSSGDHTVDLDFCSAYSGKTVKIRRARLKIRRID